jgi:glucosyl-3-phosphoglycerate synthase
LYYLRTDIIIWIDSDIQNFDKRFIIGMTAPFILDSNIEFVKGYYHRPKGDARVTEIMVRPFINYFFPKVVDFIQPLSGEYAGRRKFLESISFYSGYSVEMAVLLEASNKLKTYQIAQSYLGKRVHELQDVQSLGRMSASILWTIIAIAKRNKILKIQKNNKGLLRQFYSETGNQFKPKEFNIKDTELKAIKKNKIYAARFK